MEKSALRKFFDLVAFDQKIQLLRNTAEKNKLQIAQLEQKKVDLRSQLSVLHDEFKNIQKLVAHQELELRGSDATYHLLKQRLENAHSHKEYASVTAELSVLEERKGNLETDLLHNWNTLELFKKNYEYGKESCEQEQLVITQELEKKVQEIHSCDMQIVHNLSLRDEYTQGIVSEWIDHYDMIRNRVSDPVVAVADASCGGCYYAIPAQDMVRLEKKALLHCRECCRFLYMK